MDTVSSRLGMDMRTIRGLNAVKAPRPKKKLTTRPLTPLKTTNPEQVMKDSFKMDGFLNPIEIAAEDLVPPAIRSSEFTEIQKKKMNDAIQIIYKYYSRQRVRGGLDFDQTSQNLTIDKGELVAFCKDFGINLPKSTIITYYKKIEPTGLQGLSIE